MRIFCINACFFGDEKTFSFRKENRWRSQLFDRVHSNPNKAKNTLNSVFFNLTKSFDENGIKKLKNFRRLKVYF